MPKSRNDYEYIASKVDSLRSYPFLSDKKDSYLFSVLCVKSFFYKNTDLLSDTAELSSMIVDGAYDGGVDVLFTDPSSEACDLVIVQSKFHKTINFENAFNALMKMANFYKDMLNGHFENVSEKVQSRFLTLYSEVGEESKIKFVLYISAPKTKISTDQLESKFLEQFPDFSNIKLSVCFAADIANEIKEADSRRSTIESGKIRIDAADNILKYGSEAVIVNVSALSMKELYALYGTRLLARNLRYHIKSGGDIDRAIQQTITIDPDSFWCKNNGITIICDSYISDGKEIKLTNFSVINGGRQCMFCTGARKYLPGTTFTCRAKSYVQRAAVKTKRICTFLRLQGL